MSARVLHVVEPGGRGGVYQHILGNVQFGEYDGYDLVVLHTARDAELTPALPRLRYAFDMRWQRGGPRPLRSVLTSLWVVFVLMPRVFFSALRNRGSRWEIQGLFGPAFFAVLTLLPRLAGRRVTFVPHNSFSRSGSAVEDKGIRFAARTADEVVVFVDSERKHFADAKSVIQRKLWQYIPTPSDAKITAWKEKVGSGAPVVAFLGQLRPDKNPTLLIDAMRGFDREAVLLFAGEDKGALASIRAAGDLGLVRLIIEDGYLDLDDFVAAMLASDVVVCPYLIASQSGVAAVAEATKTPIVASAAGGLPEQAARTFSNDSDDPAGSLRETIIAVLDTRTPEPAA
ncbi:glycosyltransferase [Microbacteriaceae bacterium VKM Ac-2854]|nr:glycosyltransferase [Microbacteriaceae bacterium VKM Ac-2854]